VARAFHPVSYFSDKGIIRVLTERRKFYFSPNRCGNFDDWLLFYKESNKDARGRYGKRVLKFIDMGRIIVPSRQS